MYKNTKQALLLGLMVTFSAGARAQGAVPESWKWAHNMISSLVNTAYFATVNSNNQNTNMTEWVIDCRTWFNIGLGSVVYGIVNRYESSYLPEKRAAGTLLPGEEDNIKWWINMASSTVPMIAVNSNLKLVAERYNQTKNSVADYVQDETASTVIGGALFALRNFGFFYIIPPLLKPINHQFFKIMPKANDVSEAVYAVMPSRMLACVVFSATSLVY